MALEPPLAEPNVQDTQDTRDVWIPLARTLPCPTSGSSKKSRFCSQGNITRRWTLWQRRGLHCPRCTSRGVSGTCHRVVHRPPDESRPEAGGSRDMQQCRCQTIAHAATCRHTYGTGRGKCAMCPLIYKILSRIKYQTGCRGHYTKMTDEPLSVCMKGKGRERNQWHQEVPGQLLENCRRHELIA